MVAFINMRFTPFLEYTYNVFVRYTITKMVCERCWKIVEWKHETMSVSIRKFVKVSFILKSLVYGIFRRKYLKMYVNSSKKRIIINVVHT